MQCTRTFIQAHIRKLVKKFCFGWKHRQGPRLPNVVKVRVKRQKGGCAAQHENLYQNQFYSASVPNFVPVLNFQCAYEKRASVHHLSSPFTFQENGTRHRCPLFKDFENECHRGSRDHAFPLARRRISTLFSLNMSNNKTCEYLDPG